MFSIQGQIFPKKHLLISFGGAQVSRQMVKALTKMQKWENGFQREFGFPMQMFYEMGNKQKRSRFIPLAFGLCLNLSALV